MLLGESGLATFGLGHKGGAEATSDTSYKTPQKIGWRFKVGPVWSKDIETPVQTAQREEDFEATTRRGTRGTLQPGRVLQIRIRAGLPRPDVRRKILKTRYQSYLH